MGVYIIRGNIVKSKTDAIVNSLGINTTNKGRICHSILKAANSDELEKIIADKNGKVGTGELFITDGFDLKTRHIIHVVTPHSETDPDLSAFQSTIRNILLTAKKENYQSLAIPLIGCGADGYDRDTVFELISSMCMSFVDYYDIIIYIILATKAVKKDNAKEDKFSNSDFKNTRHPDLDLFIASAKEFKKSKNYKKFDGFYFDKKFFEDESEAKENHSIGLNENQKRKDVTLANNYKIKDIRTYIDSYLDARFPDNMENADYYKNRVKIYIGFKPGVNDLKVLKKNGTKLLSDYSNDSLPTKKTCYRIILGLRMNYNESKNFLNFFGYDFANENVRSNLEKTVVDCLNKGYYDILQIEDFLTINYKNKVHLFN